MPDYDSQDQSGDRIAARFSRSGASFQLAQNLGQSALGVARGQAGNVRVPIGCNRAEVLAASNTTATLTVRRRVQRPDSTGEADLVVVAATLALAAATTGRAVIELPPDVGTVDCVVSGMPAMTAVSVDAIITFWRES